MSMGSKQVEPKIFNPPENQAYRTSLSNYIQQILSTISGVTPGGISMPTNPLMNAAQQQYMGLLTGQDLGAGPYGDANRYMQGLVNSGENLDVEPLIQRARSTFTDITAPSLREGIGAQYGIRYGTPVAEALARGGRGATEDLNAQLVGLTNQGLQRRLQAAQGLSGLQQNTLQGAQAAGGQQIDRLLQLILGGGGAIGAGQYQYQTPQYYNNSMLPALLSIGGAVAGGTFGGPGGAAAGSAIGTKIGDYWVQ